jgi:hypothetical protein
MNYLLFGGAPNVGKSEAIKRLEKFLNIKEIETSDKVLLNNDGDFYACLDGTNSMGAHVRILVSSDADVSFQIQAFKDYCGSHEPYDVIISAIRDDGDQERANFFSIMGITPSDFMVEIPMGKITRRNTYDEALKWYYNAIDDLAHTVLGNAPFHLAVTGAAT